MRGDPHAFELRTPGTLAEALEILASAPGEWRPFAGGTDLMVLLEAGRLPSVRYVSLWRLDELRGVAVAGDAVTIGAATTYTDIARDAVLADEFPLMREAAMQTGGIATQNRGTIGGNIANASPAADTPPALLVYDAELELVSRRGIRRVPYDRFHTGYKKMDLAADEIIRGVRLPRGTRRNWRQAYRKVGTRRAQAISKVCFAAAAHVEGGAVADIRIALGSVAPTVVRCRHAEAAAAGRPVAAGLSDRAARALARDIAPIDDMRSTAHYRARVARNLLVDFLDSLNGRTA
jgi:CO/xanthine dehydrogenase FAD-binding subunit